jgi:hypothetical protein
MAKLEHKNLFAYGEKMDVYAALQRDYGRDTWVHFFWRLVFIGSAIGAAFASGRFEWLWLFAGLYAVERSIACYIDNSNRNWAMHIIDWIENSRSDSAS